MYDKIYVSARERVPGSGHAGGGGIRGLYRGRMCAGFSYGTAAQGLRYNHLGPARADRPGVPGISRDRNGHPARHYHRGDGRYAPGDHHLPHGGNVLRQPPSRQRILHRQSAGGCGPPGFHYERHRLFSDAGADRSFRRGGGYPMWRHPLCGRSRHPIPGGCPSDDAGHPLCLRSGIFHGRKHRRGDP